ncbi:MAG: thiamine phosphate synthase [Chlorobiales bacterium]|nr:thiamine phosphate synthase [Chlorobiales bacterium]
MNWRTRISERLAVYLVTDRPLCLGRSLEEVVLKAVAGGATIVQLREKNTGTREFVELARSLVRELQPRDIPLVINDRVDVALASGAAGVHVGQSDMRPEDVRRLVGPKAIVGLSLETMEQLHQAEANAEAEIDYYGVSPVGATPTETDTGAPWELEGIRRLNNATQVPLVGIGGISVANAASIIQAGAHGVAVVSAICSATCPEAATRELTECVCTACAGKGT